MATINGQRVSPTDFPCTTRVLEHDWQVTGGIVTVFRVAFSPQAFCLRNIHIHHSLYIFRLLKYNFIYTTICTTIYLA